MNRFLYLALFFLLPFFSAAQEDRVLDIPGNSLSWYNPLANTDSLKALLNKTKVREKANLLCELAFALKEAGADAQKFSPYLQEALKLSEELDYSNGKVMAWFLLADLYRTNQQDTLKALNAFRQAQSFFDHETHWTLKYRIWAGKSRIFQQLNQMDSVVFYYQKPLEALDKDTAWFAHLSAHLVLMGQASIKNEHQKKREHLEGAYQILQQHTAYLHLKGFDLPPKHETLSINLANYGEYPRALSIATDLYNDLLSLEEKSVFTDFFTAKILGRIGRIYSHWGRYEEALTYLNESIQFFDQIYQTYLSEIENPLTFPSVRLWSINAANQREERAEVLIRIGQLWQAEQDLLLSIEMRTQYNDVLGVAMCHEKLGELYAIRGKFIEALSWYQSALNLKEDLLGEQQIRARRDANFVLFVNESFASTYLKMGKLYKDWSRPELAIEQLRQSLLFSRDAGYQRREAEVLTALGDIYLVLNRPDSSLAFYHTARETYETMEYRPGLAEIYKSMGDFHFSQNAFDKAMRSYGQSQQMFAALEMPAKLASVLILQGKALMESQALQQAVEKLAEGLNIAEAMNLPRLKMEAYQGLSEIFSGLGEFEKAFSFYKNFHEIKDQLFTLETNLQIAEIEAQFESVQNRQQLLLLQREKELAEEKQARSRLMLLLLIGLIILLALFVLLYLRQNRLKTGHDSLELQQKLFRSQMNPHFIFNSLGSIQSSIINEEPDKAVKYLSRFSKLMRNILDSSENENLPLSKEIATIENYLELQKVRFPHKFDYRISGTENLEAESIYIPPMLAQPFIENALEHGIKTMPTKGLINVNFRLDGNLLTIEIEDNGIGRQKAREILQNNDKDHKSRAIDITRRRIDLLNRKSKRSIGFDIIDLADDSGLATGTRVVFVVPV
ncbi:MAG: histidine kinase [Bacteroidales bacterium]|nr:histidine kinase [Bacteroidales bacterium]